MREIKFRQWDKERKVMIRDIYFNEFNTLEEQFSDEDYVFMQYTGLKDKNGVEVFEGDILKAHKDICEVKYFKNDFEYLVWLDSMQQYFGLSYFLGFKSFEVIGNSFENPELLECK